MLNISKRGLSHDIFFGKTKGKTQAKTEKINSIYGWE